MRITWLGHAGVVIETDEAKAVIDPWVPEGSPAAPILDELRPDLVLLTHGHVDHVGEAVAIANRAGAPIVAMPELAAWCRSQGAAAELINYGGTFETAGVAAKCVPAWHSSSVGEERAYAGGACGYVISAADAVLYHAGDTCLFGDMVLIGSAQSIDVAFLPIGGRTTMDPADAVEAVRLLAPRQVVPIHYDTWPFIAQDADGFAASLEATSASGLVLEPGVAHALEVDSAPR